MKKIGYTIVSRDIDSCIPLRDYGITYSYPVSCADWLGYVAVRHSQHSVYVRWLYAYAKTHGPDRGHWTRPRPARDKRVRPNVDIHLSECGVTAANISLEIIALHHHHRHHHHHHRLHLPTSQGRCMAKWSLLAKLVTTSLRLRPSCNQRQPLTDALSYCQFH